MRGDAGAGGFEPPTYSLGGCRHILARPRAQCGCDCDVIAIVVVLVVAVVWEAVPGADGSPRPGGDFVSPGVSWLGHAPNVVAIVM